jgi:subtilisin family serine protease
MLFASLCIKTKAHAENPASASSTQNDLFAPTIWKPTWIDQNNNGIADALDQEIANRIANGTAQDYVNVTIMLKTVPTTQDAADFVSSGGYLTTSPWTEATYGFGGMITYDSITKFAQQCQNVQLIEKEAIGKVSLAYAAQQVGARTYVWDTLGLQGDPNASTAIIDTGIDASHVDFSPGYGDQDFSKKIVGWKDQVSSTTSPIDDNGHGSHVAGLAAGNGFFSVDASGYATATWGSNLGSVSDSGIYIVSGMMVNNTGTIKIDVKWARTGTASLSTLMLAYGDKTLSTGSWTLVTSKSTPSQNTIYTLTYSVASKPAGGYDMYHVLLSLTEGTGDVYVTFNMSWPYMPPSDGFSAWTGVAPQSKLVGVKVLNSAGSGTTTNLLNGLNWIISNRMTYHITAVSMSLGFDEEVPSVDSAVSNLVNSGVTVIVAAGNIGSGDNYIYSCGSVDEVITVAAMNQFDNVARYSSQGGTSRYMGRTIKPDITAPGGSFYAVPLFSADSNYGEAEGRFPEIQVNDSAPLQGTSMATPIIAGCVQVLIQAMGGYAGWNWTRSQALQPKMLLLMTATETYPNLREGEDSSTSPTLNRGGKDIHEGYGRVNLNAATDAVLREYEIGSVVTDTLGKPPTLADISGLGQKLAWARNVQLIAGSKYNFSLNVPLGADYDLYLYNSIGTTYGEPAIVAKSINATTGGTEQFWITAPYTGTYYLVVKRATETTGSGTFTLLSQGLAAVNVTLDTPGLSSASNVVHYTQNGVSKTGSIVANTFSDYVDTETSLTIDNPIYFSATQRYMTTDQSSFIIQSSGTFTVNFTAQYYISVNSDHDAPTASQWVDQGGSFTASVTSPAEIVIGDHQQVCTGYSLDGDSPQSGTSYTFINVQATHTLLFNWKTQFWIQVNSAYGSPTASAWVDQGESFTTTVTSPTDITPNNNQRVCTGYSIDEGSLTPGASYTFANIEAAHTIDFNWKQQFYLTVNSAHGSPSESGWYDSGATANAVLSSGTVSGGTGVQYVFTGWGNDTSGTDLTSNGIIMNEPKTATANWKTQYYLATSTNFGSVSPSNGWYDAGSTLNISAAAPSAGSDERYFWNGWTGSGSDNYTGTDNSPSVAMNSAVNETASWTHQYMLTVTSPYGSPTPISGWFDAGTSIIASVDSPIAGTIVTQYVCNGWTGTGSIPAAGAATSLQFTIDQPSSITWNWKTQYLPVPLIVIIIVTVALTGLAIYLLLRRRHKRRGLEAG